MSNFQVTVKEVDSVIVIATDGYLNNIGGEKISEVCDEYIDKGKNTFLINLEKSTVVNSIGVSILIEIIEKLQEVDGRLAYCNLASIVEKTFNISNATAYRWLRKAEYEEQTPDAFKVRELIDGNYFKLFVITNIWFCNFKINFWKFFNQLFNYVN